MSANILDLALEALSRGEDGLARKLVAQLLLTEPRNEQAWLMMARLSNDRARVVECLERACHINPNNLATYRALQLVKRGQATKSTVLPPSRLASSDQAIRPALTPPAAMVKKEFKPASLASPEAISEILIAPKRKLNISLIVGGLMVLLVVLIALIGPRIAPQDPLQEHAILQVGDTWVVPPISAFQVPGFILGSDQFGRDMLSRILYAVRPTLIMVTIVAVVRLFLGTLVGLGAGWSAGRLGHLLDSMISASLSVPILLVALGAITVIGAETGLIAFIIGLSINGWGETARLVRQQTELIKGQLYVESSRSLGASSIQILSRHILRQLMPMVWMLFAFEISGTLMVTAGLGFLGYYIGGDVWIEVADFVSRRISGAPELGQMLATSWVNLLQPWPLVLTGSVVFLTILGFNLLGEGMRSRLSPEFINRTSLIARLNHRISLWFEEAISYPLTGWMRANRVRPIFIIFSLVGISGGIIFYQAQIASRFNPNQADLAVPGGQIWASQRIDPYGTDYLNSIGPKDTTKLWQMNDFAGLAGSPAISDSGIVYVAGLDSKLIAMNPDGILLWQADTPEVPAGSLTLAAQDAIYVTDIKGGLSAFTTDGAFLWTYSNQAFGSPKHGAIVAPDGKIFYLLEDPRGDTLIALTPEGQLLWSVQPGTRDVNTTLRLSPDGKEIFVKSAAINVLDGSIVDLSLPTQDNPILANQAQLLVGADSKTYLLAGHIVIQWKQTSQGFSLVRSANWNYRAVGMTSTSGLPLDAGITPQGNIWLFYSGFYGGTSVFWINPSGSVLNSVGTPFYQGTELVAIDGEGTAYICGIGFSEALGAASMCQAYRRDASTPEWSYKLGQESIGIIGAALAPGRLYVVTSDGSLTALGVSPNSTPAQTPTP